MRTIIFFFFLFSFSFSQEEKRLALVIGNSEYTKGPLKNPVNDATLIAETLEKLDFEVILHKNLKTRSGMLKAISEFGQLRPMYDIGFIYYAGHGIQVNNENYLIPTEEIIDTKLEVEDYAVSLQKILRYVESTDSNKINFLVLDACRDNPYELSWSRSSKGNGLAKVPPPTGSLIAFSTDSNQTAADGEGENSLYTKSLAKNLMAENISIEQVFKNVLTEVLVESDNMQSPVYESKLTGSTYSLNKTFSIYDASIDEIFEFANSKIKDKDLSGALNALNEAAIFYKSQNKIDLEIKARFKILEDYMFFDIDGLNEETIEFRLTNEFAKLYPSQETFEELGKESHDIYMRNLTYLLYVNEKNYQKNINYDDLIGLFNYTFYQYWIFKNNNDELDLTFLDTQFPTIKSLVENLNSRGLELDLNPISIFWKEKQVFLNYKNDYFSKTMLVSSYDEIQYNLELNLKNTIKNLNSLSVGDFLPETPISKKLFAQTIKNYPDLGQEIRRSIDDIIGSSSIIDFVYFFDVYIANSINYESYFSSILKWQDILDNSKTVDGELDFNWYIYNTERLYSIAISNDDSDRVSILFEKLTDIHNFLDNIIELYNDISQNRSEEKIRLYNEFVNRENFRPNFWTTSEVWIIDQDDDVKGHLDYLISKTREINERVNKHLLFHEIYTNSDFKDDKGLLDNWNEFEDGFWGYLRYEMKYFFLTKYLKSSQFEMQSNSMNSKIIDYEKRLKLNDFIKKVIIPYNALVEAEEIPGPQNSSALRWFYFLHQEQFLTNILGETEPDSDEYLLINFFILKHIFNTTLYSTFAWEIDDIILKYQNLIELSEAKDDYLFRINIDQTLKQFISDFPYEKYRKVYDSQQLEEKINKLEQITNQT